MRRVLPWLLGVWILAAPPLAAQILPIPPAPRDHFDGINLANASAPVPHRSTNPMTSIGTRLLAGTRIGLLLVRHDMCTVSHHTAPV